ncbi:hypothetical protein BW897_31275 [Bacillus cereus]|uniref:Uncharacterized protein n=1 Tax=Bacillus cereus TaxID=1396 RepID=A0A1S9T6R3_BACCE|nr:hypothetical protein DN392_02150 [Bacillus sp. BB51/4]KXY52967.1 hypothetical protein AT265_28715 [Bacillus cereus]OOR05592.1 hypothetical protein BW897_31275 [Bacillus cereus]
MNGKKMKRVLNVVFLQEMKSFNKVFHVIIEKDVYTRKTAPALAGEAVFHNKVGTNHLYILYTF